MDNTARDQQEQPGTKNNRDNMTKEEQGTTLPWHNLTKEQYNMTKNTVKDQ